MSKCPDCGSSIVDGNRPSEGFIAKCGRQIAALTARRPTGCAPPPEGIMPIYGATGVQIGTAVIQRFPDGFRITFNAALSFVDGDSMDIRLGVGG